MRETRFVKSAALPIPTVDDDTAADLTKRVSRIVDLRNDSYRLTLEAESRFEKALGGFAIEGPGKPGFTVNARSFASGRRRIDASMHNPGAAAVRRHLANHGKGFTKFSEIGFDIWVPGRYKRIPAEDGVIYRDSAD